jgi:hypothetical protein
MKLAAKLKKKAEKQAEKKKKSAKQKKSAREVIDISDDESELSELSDLPLIDLLSDDDEDLFVAADTLPDEEQALQDAEQAENERTDNIEMERMKLTQGRSIPPWFLYTVSGKISRPEQLAKDSGKLNGPVALNEHGILYYINQAPRSFGLVDAYTQAGDRLLRQEAQAAALIEFPEVRDSDNTVFGEPAEVPGKRKRPLSRRQKEINKEEEINRRAMARKEFEDSKYEELKAAEESERLQVEEFHQRFLENGRKRQERWARENAALAS